MDARNILTAATAALRCGSLAEAESACNSVLAVFPRHHAALALLAEVLRQAGRDSEASAAARYAEMAQPGVTSRFTARATERFRAAFGPAVAPRPANETRGRVQMRSLGQNGRFGNQLLQYGLVRLYASRHDLVAEFPDWIGRDLFDLDDPFPTAILPTLEESKADFFGSLAGRAGPVFAERDVSGYFCGSTEHWAAWKSQFRALFEPGSKVRALLDRATDKLRSRGKTIVAIHLRRGDFGYGRFWVAPSSWYLAWLKSIWPNLERPVLYVASDLPGCQAEFGEFDPWHAERLGVEIPGAEFLIDHHMMRMADHLAISNSSFSFTAALLNRGAQSFLRPQPADRALAGFEPWSCPVFWDAPVDPSAVPAVEGSFVRRLANAGVVVYWGSHCSAWTNLARGVHKRLRIFEIDGDSRIADALRQRDIRHVGLLVLESPHILSRLFDDAHELFGQARVDVMLVSSEAAGAGLDASRFSLLGYELFRLEEHGVARVATDGSTLRDSSIAIRKGLATPFASEEPPTASRPRNVLAGIARWLARH